MEGRLFIDSKDVYTTFGAFVAEGGYSGLMSLPPTKPIAYNEWQEYDGIEPDLSSLKLSAHEIVIDFWFKGDSSGIERFFSMLDSSQVHELECSSISRNARLVMSGHTSLDYARRLSKVSVKFIDMTPMKGYEYLAPVTSFTTKDNASFDGHLFSTYGVRILKGTMSSVLINPSVRTALERDLSTLDGHIYDEDAQVTHKSRSLSLKCLMTAPDAATFWRNRDALVHDLVVPDNGKSETDPSLACSRDIFMSGMSRPVRCYYVGCNTSASHIDSGKIWFEFTLNFNTI